MKDPDVRPKRVCSPKYAVQKAKRGTKLNRWEIEDLAKDPEMSFLYARKVLKGRFPEGEAEIARSPYAIEYASTILRGRFPEAEPHFEEIVEGCGFSMLANRVMSYFINNGIRNAKVEKKILENNSGLISDYADKCIGGRWPEAEARMLEQGINATEYHQTVVKGRWPEWEDRILGKKKFGYWNSNRREFLVKYLKAIGKPIPEVEKKLENCNRASLLLAYSVVALKGRLPQALHQKMMMFSFDPKKQKIAKKYLQFLDNCERRAVRYLSMLDEDEQMELLRKVRTA